MAQYLIDTNVVSDYLSASFSAKGMEFMDSAIDAIPNISIITQIELLCWKTDAETEHKVAELIGDSVILGIDEGVVAECVNVRKGKKIKTPDAIIAATALARKFTIITNNEKDFVNIKGLKIVNPYNL